MATEKTPMLFPITVFEKIEENGIITKARARVFYKYANRNGGFITDEFADNLLATLPGSPVKGIYSDMLEDYTDHGKERTQGRAYGFVPETNHEIAYEEHLDDDGVTRIYACANVFLWTSLYEEAADIIGAPQSMELYEPSVKGSWKMIEGKRLFEYTEGSFLGLQALGQDVEPCFEGAAFFSLFSSFNPDFLKSLYESYLHFQLNSQNNNGGNKDMPELTFKLSDAQKANKIFQALNQTEYRYYVYETYDDSAIVYDYDKESYGKVTFTKDDSTDTVTITGDVVPVFAEYVTADEKASLDTIRAIKGTYTASLQEYNTQKETSETAALKIEELNETISTLTTEKETAETSLATATAELATAKTDLATANTKVGELETEVSTLSTYRDGVEKAEKEAVIAQYTEQLDEPTLSSFTDKLNEYTVIELEKELAFALVKSNPTVFTTTPQYTPKHTDPADGLSSVLDKYKK